MSWYQEHKSAGWIGVAVAVLLVGCTIYFVAPHLGHKAWGENSLKHKAASMRVKVVYPKEGGIERVVRRPATVQAFEFADLYAKVSGYLRNQRVDIGDRVKEGGALAEVYAPEKREDVKKSKADLDKAKASLEAVEARVERARADLTAAQARRKVSQARLAADLAYQKFREKQAKRYAGLSRDRAIDEKLVDEQEDRLQAAIEAVNADRGAVAAAEAEVKAAVAHVKQAEADVKDARAAVIVANAVLDRAVVWDEYTKIHSPYTGVITKRNYHNGDFIREAGGGGAKPPPILAVARTDKMRVIVEVPDRDVPYLHVGQQADLAIDTLPDRYFQGKVARMAFREHYETRTMRAEVDMENPDELLKDGMYGEMTIHLGREKGLRIPSNCLFGGEKDKERSVFVVRDGQAREVKVQVGRDDGIEATIRDGLSLSERVVVERPPALADGMQVEVLHESSEETVSEKQERDK
ncbi:MAG TPA: efflux RND transporter periplasmic adaptor subunit [Gemmataceae bacterium]|nr:efflux RND transporter periplasmic adaptor subunit [Gemmataceae bacterium]